MYTMATHHTVLPCNLAASTYLTRVCVVIQSRVYGTFQLHWVQATPGLQHLDLSFCPDVLMLSQSVSGPGHNNMKCTFALMTRLESMIPLEEFRCSAQKVRFGENTFGLSKLQHMKCLFLEVQGVMDPATSKWLVPLTHVILYR